MEFHEKLQDLRRQRGLTQEELAEQLFVSRTAISKWESGRGYPNIESLKAISAFFSVSLDQLLSSDRSLTAKAPRLGARLCDSVLGILAISMALLLFLPLFAARGEGGIANASLLTLEGIAFYVRIAYFAVVLLTVCEGILLLVLQDCKARFWIKSKTGLSLLLVVAAVLLFTVSLQPYAAVFALAVLVAQALVLSLRR